MCVYNIGICVYVYVYIHTYQSKSPNLTRLYLLKNGKIIINIVSTSHSDDIFPRRSLIRDPMLNDNRWCKEWTKIHSGVCSAQWLSPCPRQLLTHNQRVSLCCCCCCCFLLICIHSDSFWIIHFGVLILLKRQGCLLQIICC